MSKTPSSPKASTKSNSAPAAQDPSVKNIAPNSHVHVKIAWEKIAPVYEKHLRKVASRVRLAGFRPGKVPPALAEKSVDRSAILDPVLQELLPGEYTEVLKKENKAPLTQPEIDPIKLENGQDWELVIYFAEKPEVKLGDYKKATKTGLSDAKKEITEKEKELQERAAAAKKKALADAKSTPKDDKGADEAAPAPTPAELPESLTEPQQEDMKLKHIFKNLVETAGPAVPELLVRTEVNRDLNRLVQQLEQFQIPVEKYLASRQMSGEQLRQEYTHTAVTSLQLEFILAEIAKTEKLTVEDKEIDETLDTMNGGKLTEEQKKHPDNRSYVFSSLLKQKVVKHLLSLS